MLSTEGGLGSGLELVLVLWLGLALGLVLLLGLGLVLLLGLGLKTLCGMPLVPTQKNFERTKLFLADFGLFEFCRNNCSLCLNVA